LHGLVHAAQDILQDLAVDVGIFGAFLLDVGELVDLIVAMDGDACHAVGITPFLQGSVVQLPATSQGPEQRLLLLPGRVEPILECPVRQHLASLSGAQL